MKELGIKCTNTLCQGLASSAPIHCARAWHQVHQYTVSGLGITIHMQSTRTRQINL
jgi:hypothetical protein